MSNKHTAEILKIVTESISKRRANGRKEVVMSAKKMHAIPYAQFSTEMRSGKIIKIDDGFTKLLGYTEDDVKNGLVFKQFVPDLEYSEIIAELREQFIEKKYACYRHEVVSKTGEIRMIVAFFTIQNKLLNGHRVLEVSVADITDYTHFPETK